MAVVTIEDAIGSNGIKQKDLYALLSGLAVNMMGVAAKLNADTGVTATNYAGVTLSADITASGMRQGDILTFINSWIVAFAVITGKLDADSLTDSDYASTLNVTDVINAACIGDGSVYLGDNGVNQGTLIKVLNDCVTAHNALNAKLDADGTVNDTNYAALWNITDKIAE